MRKTARVKRPRLSPEAIIALQKLVLRRSAKSLVERTILRAKAYPAVPGNQYLAWRRPAIAAGRAAGSLFNQSVRFGRSASRTPWRAGAACDV